MQNGYKLNDIALVCRWTGCRQGKALKKSSHVMDASTHCVILTHRQTHAL